MTIIEAERLEELRSYGILDTPPTQALDALVESARRLFGVPICAVSLIDADRQWFKASAGLDMAETSRDLAFCGHTILEDEILVVEDAAADARFASNSLVTGEPGIRFYAGAPLMARPGIALGSICVIDTKPRSITEADREILKHLSTVAMALIESHRSDRESRRLASEAEAHRQRTEENSRDMRVRERQFKQTEKLAKVGGWEIDLSTGKYLWSDELYRIHGLPMGSVVNAEIALQIYSDADNRLIAEQIKRMRETGESDDRIFEIVSPSGAKKWTRVMAEAEIVDGVVARIFGTTQDITDRRTVELEMWHAAHHDVLTGLANRALFSLRLGEQFDARASAAVKGSDEAIGILMIDVDRLKEVNDTLGHEAGDVLLRCVADRLSRSVGDDAMVARIGGDEFVATFRGTVTAGRLAEAGRAILEAMHEPLIVGEDVLTPQVSIGGAFATDDDTADILRQKADLALYESKTHGRSGYAEYRNDMRTAIVRRIATVRSVDEALSEDRILPWYQPIVRLDTAEIVGLEALARMRMPDGRVMAAGTFHEALREPRIAHRLTGRMLAGVARDLRGWLDAGFPFQHVGVNVTTADFRAGDLRERIHEAFDPWNVPLKNIILEMTETVFLDGNEEAVVKTIEDLRRDGLLVALDDFGTGFASLTHLRSLPVDVIKVDKSFVDGMLVEATSGPIIEALLDLSRKLGLKLVAEGVETIAQVDRLKALGCALGQGYLFARPADADVTATLLRGFGQHRERMPAAGKSTGTKRLAG